MMSSAVRTSIETIRKKLLTNPIKITATKFEIDLNNDSATVDFEKHGDVYHLVHSSVPDQYQGNGLGAILAERVFDHIVENNGKMKIICEYLVSQYEKKFDKYKNSVVE